MSGFRGEAQLSTWISRIASHVFHDRLRSRAFKQRQFEESTELDGDRLEDRQPLSDAPKSHVDQQVIRKEMNNCIRGYIDQLPQSSREILLLSEVACDRKQQKNPDA